MKPAIIPAMSNLSAATTQHSSAITGDQVVQCSVQAVVTGTSTGTLFLEFSDDITDPTVSIQTPTNWSPVPSATVAIAGAGVYAIPVTEMCYGHFRLSFTAGNAATGTISANIKTAGI